VVSALLPGKSANSVAARISRFTVRVSVAFTLSIRTSRQQCRSYWAKGSPKRSVLQQTSRVRVQTLGRQPKSIRTSACVKKYRTSSTCRPS